MNEKNVFFCLFCQVQMQKSEKIHEMLHLCLIKMHILSYLKEYSNRILSIKIPPVPEATLLSQCCVRLLAKLTCCFMVCSFRRTVDSSSVSSWAGLWWRGGSLAAVMSSRCLWSRSLLACAESGNEPSDKWLGEDSDESFSLSRILETNTTLHVNNKNNVLKYFL